MSMVGWTILSGIWWTIGLTSETAPTWMRIACLIIGLINIGLASWKEFKLERCVDELAIALERYKNNNSHD